MKKISLIETESNYQVFVEVDNFGYSDFFIMLMGIKSKTFQHDKINDRRVYISKIDFLNCYKWLFNHTNAKFLDCGYLVD